MVQKPTVEEFAVYSLYNHGRRMTVAEVRTDIEYSHGYTREALRDLRRRGVIKGAKTDPVIASNVHGGTVVHTSSFQGMMDDLDALPTNIADQARAQVAKGDVPGLQRFIRNHAGATYQIERRWKFWYPSQATSSGSSQSPSASAD